MLRVKVDIWHNILWSKYKGAVFSALHRTACTSSLELRFFQIAETEGDRVGLSSVDLRYHEYPFKLLWRGSYDSVPRVTRILRLAYETAKSDAHLIVVAGYDKPEYWAQLIVARLLAKKVMTFCDSTYFDRPRDTFREVAKRLVFSLFQGVFCYGERSKSYLSGYGVPNTKIFVRCQAAALPFEYDPEAALRRRLERNRTSTIPTILYVGRLTEEKNIPVLLAAFKELSSKQGGVRLRIVGEGPERARLEQLASGSELGNNSIEFVGPRSGPALFDEYANAACLVLPSISEPWGLVVNEALSQGCPVIVSDRCGCVEELVIEGETGFTFDPEDVHDLLAKLEKITNAKTAFADHSARVAISHIQAYSPLSAARAILLGIQSVLGLGEDMENASETGAHRC